MVVTGIGLINVPDESAPPREVPDMTAPLYHLAERALGAFRKIVYFSIELSRTEKDDHQTF